MKIRMLKSCTFAFEPWNPVGVFESNEIYDLPSNNAHLLIDNGYAEKYEEKRQEKLNKPETENKMFNVKHKEDKSIGAVNSKSREKREKAQKKNKKNK